MLKFFRDFGVKNYLFNSNFNDAFEFNVFATDSKGETYTFYPTFLGFNFQDKNFALMDRGAAKWCSLTLSGEFPDEMKSYLEYFMEGYCAGKDDFPKIMEEYLHLSEKTPANVHNPIKLTSSFRSKLTCLLASEIESVDELFYQRA